MLTGNARSPQPEPVRTRAPDGLKFSPFSSRRKIPSEAKSEGGENISVKKVRSGSAAGTAICTSPLLTCARANCLRPLVELCLEWQAPTTRIFFVSRSSAFPLIQSWCDLDRD